MSINTNQKFTILDYIDDIKVSGDVFEKPINEFWALISLKEGLDFLYKQARKCEEIVLARSNSKSKIFAMGNSPMIAGVPKGLLTCAFHWYAVSACQYVRIVGEIAQNQNQNRPSSWQYVNSVIPEVLEFRDKVAAHFVWTKDDSRDNNAERSLSVMPMLTFNDNSFFIGGFNISQKTGCKEEMGSFEGWSITKIHQRLMKRYWPNQTQNKVCDDIDNL